MEPRSPACAPHLFCPLHRLLQLGLVPQPLLLQPSDFGQKLRLFLAARLLQALKFLLPLVQLSPLFVQISPGFSQSISKLLRRYFLKIRRV